LTALNKKTPPVFGGVFLLGGSTKSLSCFFERLDLYLQLVGKRFSCDFKVITRLQINRTAIDISESRQQTCQAQEKKPFLHTFFGACKKVWRLAGRDPPV
jgi:hypothetical protein